MPKVILFVLVVAVCGVFHNSVLAQEDPGDNSHARVAIYPEDYEGRPRYLVTYIRSTREVIPANPQILSATAITVVNQSSRTCDVQVEWFRSLQNTSVCTLVVPSLAPGDASQFCSRPVLGITTPCSRCPAAAFNEIQGKAIVSSTDVSECSRIAVDARVYYTTVGDTAVMAISNSKVVFIGEGNLGD